MGLGSAARETGFGSVLVEKNEKKQQYTEGAVEVSEQLLGPKLILSLPNKPALKYVSFHFQ